MKKSLLCAAVAMCSAASLFAAVDIQPGKPYVLRTNYGTDDFYFNMEIDNRGDGGSMHNASLSETPTTVYFQENPNQSGQWAICYSPSQESKSLGVGGNNGVSGHGWNAVINSSGRFYWTMVETEGTSDTQNPIIKIKKASANEYLGLNENTTPAEAVGVWANHPESRNRLEWELIPVDMPNGIELNPAALYLMSMKGSTLNMQMREPATDNGNGIKDQLATLSSTITTPIYLVPKYNSDKVSIVCDETGKFLSYSEWNSVINNESATGWTISMTEEAETSYYTFHHSDGNAGYLGMEAGNVNDGAKIYSDAGSNSGKTYNYDWKLTEYTPNVVSLTVNYKLGDLIVESTTLTGNESYQYTISDSPSFTTHEPVSGLFSSSVTSVDVPVTEAVPFLVSPDVDHLVWQAVSVHSNQKWILTYSEDESTVLFDYEGGAKSTRFRQNTPWSDEELWAFVGNLVDGYMIINKKAGAEKTLYKPASGHARVGVVTENNKWNLMPSTAVSESQGCAFRMGTSDPMNAQGNANEAPNDGYLTTWTYADAGSTWTFYSFADPMLNYYDNTYSDYANTLTGVVNAKTQLSDISAVDAAKEAAAADPYNAEKAQAFSTAITNFEADIENTPIISFNHAIWYRLKNVQKNGYLVSGKDDSRLIYGGETSERTNYNSIVKFERIDNGRFHILSQGLYFGHTTGEESTGVDVNQVEDETERGEYTFSYFNESDPNMFIIDATQSETNLHYLQHSGDGNKVQGGAFNNNGAQWYLCPVSELDVNLTQQYEGKYIGTGYFPFPVKAVPGVELYYICETTANSDNSPALTYIPKESVPAHTAFLIMSEGNVATLNIDYDGIAALEEPANVLSGTLRKANASEGDYTFNGDEFVKSTSAPEISGNTAWIPASAVAHPEQQTYSLLVPDATGITEITNVQNGAKVVYDLQGRRVAHPGKGLYIVNGVKTLVR